MTLDRYIGIYVYVSLIYLLFHHRNNQCADVALVVLHGMFDHFAISPFLDQGSQTQFTWGSLGAEPG